jgi:glutaconate CoA-transferase subunit A
MGSPPSGKEDCMREKLMDAREAVERFVGDGSSIAISGVGRNASPMGLVREIIRQRKRNLTIIGPEKGMDFDILIGAGCVKEVVFAFVTLEEFGFARCFRRAAESGAIEVTEHT